MDNAPFRQRFIELQQRFLERTEADRDKMAHGLASLQDAADYAGELKGFYFLIHQYSGNGRTFGFPAISDAAIKLETALQKAGKKQDFMVSLSALEQLSQELLAACDQAQAKGRAT